MPLCYQADSSLVPYGTSYLSGAMAWRIPIWCQMFFSGIVLLGCLLLPEVHLIELSKIKTHS